MKTPTIRAVKNRSAKPAAQQSKSKSARATTPAEFKIVRLRECPVDSPMMDNPPTVEKVWREHVATADSFKADKECLVVFLLNTRRHLIGFETLSQGTRDQLLVNPSEVFRMAAARDAAAIVIAHNHPSGDPSPSDADIKVTRELIRAGELLKVELLDHVIIGAETNRKGYSSLRELGYIVTDFAKEIAASAKRQEAPGTLVPSDVVDEMCVANDELNRAASAAVAAGLLNSASICENVKAFGGWEDFETPRLKDGMFETVRTAETFFDGAFTDWQKYTSAVIAQVRDCKAVLSVVPREQRKTSLLERYEPNDGFSTAIENAVRTLKECVALQGWVLGQKDDLNGSYFLGEAIKDRLKRAFDSAWAASGKLDDAFFAMHDAGQLKPEAAKLAA